ncbi:carboxypeptidase N subunit 2 [Eurosta solidaginis]|uniref:carboxypeptidase N subunit 2 n=1 Tax=Eurosta solidaginis TaxID=178769 RepID=UPI003531715D
MLTQWFVICLLAMPVLTGTGRKCPKECKCDVDEKNRRQVLCIKGGLSTVPVSQIEPDVRVIMIKGPGNNVTIGPYFQNFSGLEVLRIIDSQVPSMGYEFFWGLIKLRILDLSGNNITIVNRNSLRGQDNLHELDLSRNKIFNISSSTFDHLTELHRLSLADNSIMELVPRNFFLLNKLKYLDLSGNPLQDLPPDVFRDVPALRIFKCRNCQLKKINPQFYNLLPMLSELDLGRNEFKFLDKDEFRDVKRLTKVLLDGNQLSVVVDELFRNQKSLLHLDLSYNRLAKVPNNSFQHLHNLTFLDLSYNKLVRLEPQSVRSLSNLQTLNISGNVLMSLHEMRETFEVIPQLTHLSIADMGILPMGLLVPFKQLRYLNISGNHLDNMSLQVIDPCRELEFLDLSRNQLYGINEDTVLRIQRIRNVRLDNNPLICDECHMGKLINVVQHLESEWETYPICFLPKPLRGFEITDLDVSKLSDCLDYITDEEQNAASTSHNFLERGGLNTLAILGGIILVLIVVIILAMAVCFSKRRARYYTREDRLNGGESGKCIEKSSEATNGKTVNGGSPPEHTKTPTTPTNEINFKFPIDDRVCTIDELVLPPAPPPPAKEPPSQLPHTPLFPATNSILNSLSYSSCSGINTATSIAAVAAAATVIPPGAPSVTTSNTAYMLPAPNSLPAEAIVVVLPTASMHYQNEHHHHQQHQQQQPQQLHLTTIEPLISVN